jgi:hypothetical protein
MAMSSWGSAPFDLVDHRDHSQHELLLDALLDQLELIFDPLV